MSIVFTTCMWILPHREGGYPSGFIFNFVVILTGAWWGDILWKADIARSVVSSQEELLSDEQSQPVNAATEV